MKFHRINMMNDDVDYSHNTLLPHTQKRIMGFATTQIH
jgi:hypothetical protein